MTEKIKKDSMMLLLGEKKSYLIRPIKFSCECGFYDLNRLVGKKYGLRIKIGKENFTVVRPGIIDFLRKAKRGPQIIMPKDASAIVGITGCSPGWRVVDAGAGSGFLSMFLANLGCEVHSYEKKKEFFDIVRRNTKNFGFKNIIVKNADITKGIKEKDVDLITLDMQNPEKAIKNAFKALKAGGWLAVYSMHVEEVKEVYDELKKYGFTSKKIMEIIQRDWQSVGKLTRPRNYMLAHTGFLTFARKM
jgi:tRNA (adenine57-N1/adenine58-N1)-methyltransferase